MSFYNESREAVLNKLEVESPKGLSGEQAQQRFAEYGPNKLSEKKKKTFLQRFLDQFRDVMILILIAAAALQSITSI